MPYCHKCGSEINEKASFCSQCGVTLKAGTSHQRSSPDYFRNEKGEKQEKNEKNEKNEKEEKMEKGEQQEKFEKKEYDVLGSLLGGIILIFVGFMLYLAVTGAFSFSSIFPFFLIIIGVIIVLGIVLGAIMANKRNPVP
ncbi:zinc-ribbon domain-containing protein [Candidatus Bathyarchaeota archaeon]|nr:zinc-ribbon domain-containing protein [Candidatus Bathyarchaeota archaeon]